MSEDKRYADGLDESDAALAERLKGAIAQGRYEVGATEEDAARAQASDDEAGGSGGSGFFEAMNAYRAARATGDAEVIARAERRLQEVTRADLAEFERGQGRSSIPHQDIHGRW